MRHNLHLLLNLTIIPQILNVLQIQAANILIINLIRSLMANYKLFLNNQLIPGRPTAAYDSLKKTMVHIYQNITLEPSNFQKDVSLYLSRKQSYSGHVVVINKIKDQHITYHIGKAAMEISIVTDYVPWRLHLQKQKLSFQQALMILFQACKGFRELLHRVRLPFLIHESMIGIDGNGSVKIWWNDTFHKNIFGFTMTTNVKLRQMVKSLMETVLTKIELTHKTTLESILSNSLETFAALQQKIQEIAIGINFKDIGKKLTLRQEEHRLVLEQSKQFATMRQNSMVNFPRVVSNPSIRPTFSSQKVILSPRKEEPLEFRKKIIVKRTYRDGTLPQNTQKMIIIKKDIQKLRSVVEKKEPQAYQKLQSSRSLQALFSVKSALRGDTSIPQIKKIIKQAEVFEKEEDFTVSRFVQPKFETETSIFNNPENNSPYRQLLSKKEDESGQSSPLFLAKLKGLISQKQSINSTIFTIQSRYDLNLSPQSPREKTESAQKVGQNLFLRSF